jgi:uncharacterized ParB-like nuclease family protein
MKPRCLALSTAQWAEAGVSVKNTGKGTLTVGALGAISTAPGWYGVPNVLCAFGAVTTLAKLGPGSRNMMNLATIPDGSVVLASTPRYASKNTDNNALRWLDVTTSKLTTFSPGTTWNGGGCQDGKIGPKSFSSLSGVEFSPDGKYIYAIDEKCALIRKIDIASKTVSTLAGSGKLKGFQCGAKDGVGTAVEMDPVHGSLTMTADGKTLAFSQRGCVRTLDIATKKVTTLVGKCFSCTASNFDGFKEGIGAAAALGDYNKIEFQGDGKKIFVSQRRAAAIGVIDVSTRKLTKLVGGIRPQPVAVSLCRSGCTDMFCFQYGRGHCSVQTQKYGSAKNAVLCAPDAIHATADGSTIFVVDGGFGLLGPRGCNGNVILKINTATGYVVRYAGRPNNGGTTPGKNFATYKKLYPDTGAADDIQLGYTGHSGGQLTGTADGKMLYLIDEVKGTSSAQLVARIRKVTGGAHTLVLAVMICHRWSNLLITSLLQIILM